MYFYSPLEAYQRGKFATSLSSSALLLIGKNFSRLKSRRRSTFDFASPRDSASKSHGMASASTYAAYPYSIFLFMALFVSISMGSLLRGGEGLHLKAGLENGSLKPRGIRPLIRRSVPVIRASALFPPNPARQLSGKGLEVQ